MNIKFGLGLVGALGLAGCATSGVEQAHVGFGVRGQGMAPSVHVVEARVLDTRVNPMVPVSLESEGSAVAVTYGRTGGAGASTRIDPSSLRALSSRTEGPVEGSVVASTGASRVALEGNRYLLCWTAGSVEWGRYAMAQVFDSADGSALGEPVEISAPDVDVVGAPRAASADGRHVVVTFTASSGHAFELNAVSLEDAAPEADSRNTRETRNSEIWAQR